MTVRERIKLKKRNSKKTPTTDYLIKKIIKGCDENNVIDGLKLCDFEDCKLYKTEHCEAWKYWTGDEEYIEKYTKEHLER